jgi:hypothetical protein
VACADTWLCLSLAALALVPSDDRTTLGTSKHGQVPNAKDCATRTRGPKGWEDPRKHRSGACQGTRMAGDGFPENRGNSLFYDVSKGPTLAWNVVQTLRRVCQSLSNTGERHLSAISNRAWLAAARIIGLDSGYGCPGVYSILDFHNPVLVRRRMHRRKVVKQTPASTPL